MKKIFITTILIFAAGEFGCNSINKSQVSENAAQENSTVSKTENPTGSNVSTNSAPPNTATPAANKNATANANKTQAVEPLPRRIDDNTAESPVYKINSKNCTNHDDEGSEGDEFVRRCKGYGKYMLHASGGDYRVNYGIASTDPRKVFDVMLFPLETGEAQKYVRADQYDLKLGDKIEWLLDDKGESFAVIVHASFYKNTGSVKTFDNPKNKVAEFVFLRGLAGHKDLDYDVSTVDTPYNPDEQARMLAYKKLERGSDK